MEQKITTKQLKQRQFFTVLPVLVLPFLTMAFWALGGGSGLAADRNNTAQTGINIDLPDVAATNEGPLDKMAHYKKMALDSAKLKELWKNDPYFSRSFSASSTSADTDKQAATAPEQDFQSTASYSDLRPLDEDNYEEQLLVKLEALNKAMATPEEQEQEPAYPLQKEPLALTADVDRLEHMMESMQQKPDYQDTEMLEMNRMLERILDIQHPERVQVRLQQQQQTAAQQAFAIKAADQDVVSLLTEEEANEPETVTRLSRNGFYGLEDEPFASTESNTLPAVIHETQTLVSGATIKLRLLKDVIVNGMSLKKDHFLFGTATVNGERLQVSIQHIRSGEHLLPVALSVHDADGMKGIHIPGAISRDVAKQSGDRVAQSFGMTTVNPTLGAQAAGAGIEAARSLLSKKIKLVKVTVKAGYRVWLKDEKQQ